MLTRDQKINKIRRLSAFIDTYRTELRNQWTAHLSSAKRDAASRGPLAFPIGIESENDLLSVLQGIVGRDGTLIPRDLEFHLAEVRDCRSSVADVFAEIISLDHAFTSTLLAQGDERSQESHGILDEVRNALNQAFAEILHQTTDVYKHVIETGHQPLCLLNKTGQILYANSAMVELLGGSPKTGIRLGGYLAEYDGALLEKALASDHADEPCVQEIHILRVDGTKISVSANIHPMDFQGSGIGGYATFSDNSDIVAREQKFFDRLSLAAVKLDRDDRITYANKAATELLEAKADIRGRNVYDLFRQNETTAHQLDKRRAGEGGVYETDFIRPSDRRKIPVSIAGTPIIDDREVYVGTLGIIRSLEREKAAEAIHRLIDTERDDHALLGAVAQLVEPLVPFDYFGVTEHSRSGDDVSTWFSFVPGQPMDITRRWWPIEPAQKSGFNDPLIVSDFSSFIREKRPGYEQDLDVKKFIEQGFQSMMRFPIIEQERVVASVVLLSKRRDFYNDGYLKMLLELPIEQAVQMAVFYKRLRSQRFSYDLFKDMVKCSTAKDVALLLAQRLAEHRGWHHISIFKVSESDRMFKRLAEFSTRGANTLPSANQEQPLTEGVLGYVYQSGLAVNIPDVPAHSLYTKFVVGWEHIRSEMCHPIIWDNKVQWLFNVEDERVAAFSKDEEEDLGIILQEAALIVSRISAQYLLESAFQSSSDSVFVTDNQAEIVLGNSAAARLLGYANPAEINGPFERIFHDKQASRRIFETTGHAGSEIDLLRKDQTTVSVLISGSDLPEDLSRKVFVAKDLTLVKRLRQLETLRKLFQEIALQTHTPLALVETWMRNLKDRGGDEDIVGYSAKVLGQLKKMEISYDRLALCADSEGILKHTEKQHLDLGVELKRTVAEFPASEAERIEFKDPGELPYVLGDPMQVSFVLSSILAYLIRYAQPDVSVKVRFWRGHGTVKIVFGARVPSEPEPTDGDWRVARARFELALGEPTIVAFVENNGAKYCRETKAGEMVINLLFAEVQGES